MEPSLIQAFQAAAGAENVMHEEADRAVYAYDAAVLTPVLPALVVRPANAEAAAKVLALCHENERKVTVRGAGTNLSGGTIPDKKGVVLLTNALNRILEINPDDMYAVVEPGVITAKFAAAVAAENLFYPPDPGSQSVSTLGGNVAENAGGLRGLKYGVTGDYVMGLTFLDASGEVVKTGGRTVKCVTGYNLTGLLVGAEGTLGFVSEIILQLIPPPRHKQSMTAVFNDIEGASQTVSAVIAAHIVPATLEILDNFTICAVERYSKAGLPTDAGALLLIETDGHRSRVEEDAETIAAICKAHGARELIVARNDAERNKVWEARRAALSALAQLKPTVVLEDATVPRSKIPDMVRAVQDIGARYNLDIGTFGHAGDGNLHPTILTDRRNREEWRRVEAAIDDIFDHALSLGGTLSGEHGIGTAKSRYLAKETGAASIRYSRRIKSALDPKGILNPGKIIGET